MDNKFFDKILEQIIDDATPIYLENEQKQYKEENDINFSELHNAKMKKLFKEVKAQEDKKKILVVTKKVAIVLICTIVVSICLIGTVAAWRKEVIKFIMKNNADNYMSISFGEDNDEKSGDMADTIIDEETNTYIIDGIKFLYVPEGFEYKYEKTDSEFEYIGFKEKINPKNYIILKKEDISKLNDKSLDIERVYSENLTYGDKEVFKVKKDDGRLAFVWYDKDYLYSVVSNIEDENEIIKFIDNVRILKNF